MSSDLPLPRVPEGSSDPRVDLSTLRERGDPCYKCSVCDSECPVAPVDADFPGPKFQGPEQWRLRSQETPIDPSIDACTNCLRCHAACPEDVDLASMHNVARAERKTDSALSRTYIRDRLLANYGVLARIASKTPRLSNWLANNTLIREAADRLLGITAERTAPEFAEQTFREWWDRRGGAQVSSDEKRVAYFHGDYANYNTPAVGKALVQVYESLGYEVAVPPQRCSGTPMFANGFLEDAERNARFNVEHLLEYIDSGYDVVATCTSCSMALREEYPSLFEGADVEILAANTYDAIDYLRANEDLSSLSLDDEDLPSALSYHAPCHASAQGVAGRSLPLLEASGLEVTNLGDDCSGMSGTYGWKAERYEASMEIGQEMFEGMEAAAGTDALTECPTCAMQMEHGTGYDVSHPIELVATAMNDS